MAAKSISDYLSMALLVFGAALAGWNWYLRPESALAWGSTLFLFACMGVALFLARRRHEDESAPNRAGDSIRGGVVFAGLIMVSSLGLKLATALGALQDPDLARRAPLVLMGAFFVFSGNAMPKMLTPLSRLRCDPARVQAFQRFTGWTWVLAGLALAVVWVVLPIDQARIATFVLMPSVILIVVSQMLRLRGRPLGQA